MSYFENVQQTPWGYVIDAKNLPDLLTYAEFNNFTAGKFGADTRINSSIPAASRAIRNYCGWHVSPELRCGVLYNVHNIRDAFVGGDLLIQLPATFVTGIAQAIIGAEWNEEEGEWHGRKIEGTSADLDFDAGSNLLRVFDVGCLDKRTKIFIEYTAGYPTDKASELQELAANLVTHAVVNPYGVASESAGGVSVSYSSAWAASSGASMLSEACKEMLAPYKVKGVF